MVVVGTRKNGQVAVVGSAVDKVQEPDQVMDAGLLDAGVLLEVNGRTPLPGGPDVEAELLPLEDPGWLVVLMLVLLLVTDLEDVTDALVTDVLVTDVLEIDTPELEEDGPVVGDTLEDDSPV
jgi:hypothetical protein